MRKQAMRLGPKVRYARRYEEDSRHKAGFGIENPYATSSSSCEDSGDRLSSQTSPS